MPKLLSQTAKLVPYPKRLKSQTSLATAYQFEPPAEIDHRGSFLAVIEVVSGTKQAEELIDIIIETTGKSYYEAPEQADETNQDRFEAAIKAVNEELAIYATQGNASWVGKISAVLAVLQGEELMITQTGSAQGYLYRHKHGTCITTGLATDQPYRPSKTFSQVASGTVEAGDRILLTTPALLHLIGSAQLSTILIDSGASAAVQKCHELLQDQTGLERVAAIVVEVSTSEMAQMTPQPGLPSELRLGKPESAAELAKYRLGPIVTWLRTESKAAWTKLRHFATTQLTPWLKRVSLKTVQLLRKWLNGRRSRWVLLGGVVIVIALIALAWHNLSEASATSKLETSYHQAWQLTDRGQAALAGGDKSAAGIDFKQALGLIATIQSSHHLTAVDKALSHHSHPEADPASVAGLKSLLDTDVDQLNGLAAVTPRVLIDFASLSGTAPTLLATVGSELVCVQPDGPIIDSFSLTTGKLDHSLVRSPGLGRVTAIATATNSTGVYLLTDHPAVWLYRSADHTLVAQSTSGSWASGKAMATFAGNLYILNQAGTGILKFPAIASGFGASIGYLASGQSLPGGAASLAIDGSIYVGGPGGYQRYLAGSLQPDGLSLPANLSTVDQIVSTNGGTTLVTVDAATDRLGLLSFDGSHSHFSKELTLSGYKHIAQIAADPNAKVIYALADQKLVSFSY